MKLGHFDKHFVKNTIRAFLSKTRTLFFPSCVPVSLTEYASISLNMPKYPWKHLYKLFWQCQDSEYACSSSMFDRLLKMPLVLSKPGFWIWHGCMCKRYGEFWICLNIAPYASVMPENVLMSLNMPEHG